MTVSLSTLKLHNERFDALVDELKEHFSMRPVVPTNSIEEIMYRAGQASVIEYLEQKLEEDN